MATLSTVAAFGFDDFDPPVTLGLYKQLGCQSSQFYRNENNPPTVEDAIRIADDAGLPFDSIHGVFGEQYDPSNPDEAFRRQTVEVYQREGELAIALGGPMVVVHPSSMRPPDQSLSPDDRAVRMAALRKSIDELTVIGEKLGVTYLWENITFPFWVGADPIELAGILREVNSPAARMCFDTGHALMTGTVADRLAACSDVVSYMHVHDNNGEEDSHLMPGDGVTDWPAITAALRSKQIDVPAMLEVFYLEQQLTGCVKAGLGEKLAEWLNTDAASPHRATRP